MGIDFDNVIFDTGKFKEFLDQRIEGFTKTYPEEGVYDPEEHAEKLGVDSSRIKEAVAHSSDFIFDDIDQLGSIRENHELVLVTRGDPEFQRMKVENSGVLDYFDRVVIVNSGSKDQADIDVLIDDTEFELDNVDVEGFHFDREKDSLEDVVNWVKRLEARRSV